MSALRSPAGCGRGTVSRLRLAHDAAFYYRTSGSRGRLSPPFASCGSESCFCRNFARTALSAFMPGKVFRCGESFFVLAGTALFLSNVAAAVVFLLFGILASLAMLFLWIVLTLKAWQGERFEIPLFGQLATRLH